MKTHCISMPVVCAMLFWGTCSGIPEESQKSDPIVVKIADIHREDFAFRPYPRGDRDVWLFFFFERKGKAEVDALREEGLRSNRPVHIFDGTNLVAKCKIVGGASSQEPDVERYGLILGFDSIADAERAVTAMSENWQDYIRRKVNDRRTWRI